MFIFSAKYHDTKSVEIAVNFEFSSLIKASFWANLVGERFGKLPAALRTGVKTINLHKGEKGFHAGPGTIVLYEQKVKERLKFNYFEESLFHESVHASWDHKYGLSNEEWVAAQRADGVFLTEYGKNSPYREDLAETALLVFGIMQPGQRIPSVDSYHINNHIPHRVKYVQELFYKNKEQPIKKVKCTNERH